MKVQHELKIDQEHFEAVKDGRKKFEIRKNDRDYHVGDLLVLREYNPNCRSYTDESIRVEISYMTDYAQKDGYVVLGIEEIWEGEELTEIKKVVIPKFVAELLESEIKDIHDLTFFGFVKVFTDEGFRHNESIEGEFVNWITEKGNESKLMRAWLDGYEVEKEKLYYVKLPVSIWNNHLDELETNWGYLQHDITSDETNICICNRGEYANFRAELTEERIKSIDERYWAFAVEVED